MGRSRSPGRVRFKGRYHLGVSRNGLDRLQEAEMVDVVAPSWRVKPRPLVLVAGLAGALVAATLALWVHYGTAVFFEMIRAGFAACF